MVGSIMASTFVLKEIDGVSYLTADFSISTADDAYVGLAVVAGLGTVVYAAPELDLHALDAAARER